MLIGNGLRLGSNPMRYLDGQVAYTQHRALQLTPGGIRGFYNGAATGGVARKAAFPRGYNHTTGAWQMPPKGGDMGAARVPVMTGSLAGGMFTGVAILGATTFSFTTSTSTLSTITHVEMEGRTNATVKGNTSSAQLIVTLAGTASVGVSTSTTLVGVGVLIGTAAAKVTGNASVVSAEGNLSGNAHASMTCSSTVHALGNMIGHITPFTVLSPENLAAAVWTAESEAQQSYGKQFRDIVAVQLGVTNGGGTDTETFMASDGVTPRVVSTNDKKDRLTVTRPGV